MNDSTALRDYRLIIEEVLSDGVPPLPHESRWLQDGMFVTTSSQWRDLLEIVGRIAPTLQETLRRLLPTDAPRPCGPDDIPATLLADLEGFLLRTHDMRELFGTDSIHEGHFIAYYTVENTLKSLLLLCRDIVDRKLQFRAGPLL